MKVEVLSKEENKLLNRLEVKFALQYEEGGTPTRDIVRGELEKLLKAKGKLLVIDHISTEFGKREARGYAKLYDTIEEASKVERRHVLRRNKLLEAQE